MRRDFTRKRNISHPALFTSVLLVCLLCWAAGYSFALGFPLQINSGDTPLWEQVCTYIPNKEYAYLIGLLFMLGGAFLLHRANYALALIREKTLLPFLFFVLFISTNPSLFPLKSYSLGVFCMILAVYELFTSYHDPEAKGKAFNGTFF